MKRLLISGALLLCVIILMAAGPAPAAEVKIGIIDTQKIMRESRAAKKARGVLSRDMAAKKELFQAKEREVRALQEELKKADKDMSESARREKGEKFEQEVKELRRLKSDLEEEFKKKDREMAKTLLQEIQGVVKEFLVKEKYTVILEKRSVVASDDAIDVTDKIISIYDAAQ